MSRRRFLGWEPVQVTSTETAPDGTTVTVTRTEPEWDDDERGWAEALLQVEAETCQGCGAPLTDALQSLDPDALWIVEEPDRCLGCTALEIHRKQYEDHPQPSALRFPLPRRRDG